MDNGQMGRQMLSHMDELHGQRDGQSHAHEDG